MHSGLTPSPNPSCHLPSHTHKHTVLEPLLRICWHIWAHLDIRAPKQSIFFLQMHICGRTSGTLSLCENILCPCVFVHIMPAVQSATKHVRKTLRLTWLPAPSAWRADSTSLPQQLLHWLQMERVILDGCCSKHGLLQTGFQEWVTVRVGPFARLRTLFGIVTSCTFPITPFTLLQILRISNEISVVCNGCLHLFPCPHWTGYEI